MTVHAVALLVDFNDNLAAPAAPDYYNQVSLSNRTAVGLKTSTGLNTGVTLSLSMSASTLASSGTAGMRNNLSTTAWSASAAAGKFDAPAYVQGELGLNEASSSKAWADSHYAQNEIAGLSHHIRKKNFPILSVISRTRTLN